LNIFKTKTMIFLKTIIISVFGKILTFKFTKTTKYKIISNNLCKYIFKIEENKKNCGFSSIIRVI
jgi:hypothetical protein